ncbi:MAG TPA: phosphoglucosamine mutase [Patescibacteria group bacterium]|nr:phosphoglucosamine mutase [Patescibacteria group bacterium]
MKRLFGTDGVRGVAGEFPLDPPTVARIGQALVDVLAAGDGPPRVLIGRDTRESGPAIEDALARGIESRGGRADRGGVLTTPAVACVTRAMGYDAGIVVSASHNPYRDNGIKVFSREGAKLPDAIEVQIEHRVLEEPGAAAAPPGSAAAGAAPGGAATHPAPETLRDCYLDWLRAALPAGTSFAGRRLVLDCANGAASDLAPRLFRALGAEVVAIHDTPDGRNINEGCGALHPEQLASEVTRRRAWLGLAFDGDADRCLPVDGDGRVLDGDYVLCLAARDLRARGGLRGDAVVGTVMTNLWLERSLRAEGIGLTRAPVGDKYVLEEMQRSGSVLGGEQSGHIIFLERATTGDGLLTGLMLMELLQRNAIDLAAWASTITPCPQILINVPVRERPPLDAHPVIGAAIRSEEAQLHGRGRVLVRYSGTEPKARIMVEGEPRAAIEASATRLRQVIEAAIGLATR